MNKMMKSAVVLGILALTLSGCVSERATGLTPHAYLLDVRVKRAREDLEKGTETVADIARRYRFPTARHFATVFKRIVGLTPRQCRI